MKAIPSMFWFVFLLPCFLFSQEVKGVKPIVKENTINNPETRAVVVGISNYQNKDIPDLRFAHRDAEAFAEYLRSDAGGNLDDDHLVVLTNEEATAGKFVQALDWLIDESKKDDNAIIYFSGHGDVETKTMFQMGFLLCWDSPPKTYPAGGTLTLYHLQAVISTLSLEKKAKVTIITDACRSGKLAGGAINGSQLTNTNLTKKFANEIKILSCQPNEYSIEGEQWGGGRGAFSFHLIDGLYGMADKNTDLEVTLSEIDRYLEDRVTPEVAPFNQMPMTVGLKGETIAKVDEVLLATILAGKSKQRDVLSKVESKGIEDEILASITPSARQQYLDFQSAIENKQFFEPYETSAEHLFKLIIQEPSLSRLHNHIKRNYAAALQDDTQQMLNDYLYAPHKEFDMPSPLRLERYTRFVRQLEKAIELLGENHYMYLSLLGRKLFIEGQRQAIYAELYGGFEESRLKRIELYHLSLEYEPNAAYVYNSLGAAYGWGKTDKDHEKAIAYCQKAIELSPNWGPPYYLMYLIYKDAGQNVQGIEIMKKGLEKDPNSPYIHSRWGGIQFGLGRYEEAEKAYLNAIRLDSTHAMSFLRLGYHYYYYMDKKQEAEKFYLKCVELIGSDVMPLWEEIFSYYEAVDSLDKIRQHLEAYIDAYPNSTRAYKQLGRYYRDIAKEKDYEKAEAYFNKALSIDSNDPWPYYLLGQLYHYRLQQYDTAIVFYEKTLSLNPSHIFAPTGLGQIYEIKEDYATTIKILEKAREIRPYFPQYLRILSRCYEKLGNEQKAIYFIELHRENAPSNFIANDYYRLIKLFVEDGQLSAANNIFQELAEKHPMNYAYAARASHLLGKKAEYNAAVQLAIDNAKDASDYYRIGRIYAYAGHLKKSIKWLRKAFDAGYDDFDHIKSSEDLDPIRNANEFNDLIREYFIDGERKK